jgi:hypothetical protein
MDTTGRPDDDPTTMNVVITPTEYKLSRVYFTEKKPNTHIPNSTFNRITYSTNDFIMNGIYIHFELFVRQIEQNFNSNIYNSSFDCGHEYNKQQIEMLQKIEADILDKWVRLEHSGSNSRSREKTTDIIEQLRTGVISVWKNELKYGDKSQFQHFIIKISGIWENEGICGLTYKFI